MDLTKTKTPTTKTTADWPEESRMRVFLRVGINLHESSYGEVDCAAMGGWSEIKEILGEGRTAEAIETLKACIRGLGG